MQENQSECSESADDEGFRCCIFVDDSTDTDEDREVQNRACSHDRIVNFLLPVPAYGCVLKTHLYFSQCKSALTGVVDRRTIRLAANRNGRTAAMTIQIRR